MSQLNAIETEATFTRRGNHEVLTNTEERITLPRDQSRVETRFPGGATTLLSGNNRLILARGEERPQNDYPTGRQGFLISLGVLGSVTLALAHTLFHIATPILIGLGFLCLASLIVGSILLSIRREKYEEHSSESL